MLRSILNETVEKLFPSLPFLPSHRIHLIISLPSTPSIPPHLRRYDRVPRGERRERGPLSVRSNLRIPGQRGCQAAGTGQRDAGYLLVISVILPINSILIPIRILLW